MQVAAGQIGQQPVPPGQQFQLTINTLGRLIDPEQFGDIIIKVRPTSAEHASAALRHHGTPDKRLNDPTRRQSGQRRPPARRGPHRAGLAAIRPVLHARRPAVGGPVDLPASRLERPAHRPRRLRQDGGTEAALSRRLEYRSSTTRRRSSANRSARSSRRCATRSSWWRSWCWSSCKTGGRR